MTKFEITKLIPQTEGIASTLKDEDTRDIYADAVEKFISDNSDLGETWKKRALDLLIEPIYAPSDSGDLRGSNSYECTFLAQIGIPLIKIQELMKAYKKNGQNTPLPRTYVETGLALIPQEKMFEENPGLAKRLYNDFKQKNIRVGKGKVINFTQLRLSPDSENCLSFRLNENSDDIPNIGDYPWASQGKSGLYRVYLDGDSYWYADDDNLEYSNEGGRVVRYDAEGVAPKKLGLDASTDFVKERLNKFRNMS